MVPAPTTSTYSVLTCDSNPCHALTVRVVDGGHRCDHLLQPRPPRLLPSPHIPAPLPLLLPPLPPLDRVLKKRRQHRNSVSPNELLKIHSSKIPNWVGDYLCRIGSVLRDDGWEESNVTEMVHIADAAIIDDYDILVALEKLVLKADRYSAAPAGILTLSPTLSST
ncbi:hypothetical protein J5N97_022769 [Dioscorea zingiberensis]|uniref:Uncharacterized protein n=1 Tax=Dioscorea zingiberensis TaxID=325984 RepID=A0A9D5CB32_9LILI|nr:hypothetical protein J5N97_022769 [Dioscorea zingiberensis]